MPVLPELTASASNGDVPVKVSTRDVTPHAIEQLKNVAALAERGD